ALRYARDTWSYFDFTLTVKPGEVFKLSRMNPTEQQAARIILGNYTQDADLARIEAGDAAFLAAARSEVRRAAEILRQRDLLKEIRKLTLKDHPGGFPPDGYSMPGVPAEEIGITGIGLYLMSIVSAEKLGFISRAEALRRTQAVLEKVSKMEMYDGLYYRYYMRTRELPVAKKAPEISALDNGWLATGLMIAEQHFGQELGDGAKARLDGMNFAQLYDPKEKQLRLSRTTGAAGVESPYHYSNFQFEGRHVYLIATALSKDVAEKKYQRIPEGVLWAQALSKTPLSEVTVVVNGQSVKLPYYRPHYGGALEQFGSSLVLAGVDPNGLGRLEQTGVVLQIQVASGQYREAAAERRTAGIEAVKKGLNEVVDAYARVMPPEEVAAAKPEDRRIPKLRNIPVPIREAEVPGEPPAPGAVPAPVLDIPNVDALRTTQRLIRQTEVQKRIEAFQNDPVKMKQLQDIAERYHSAFLGQDIFLRIGDRKLMLEGFQTGLLMAVANEPGDLSKAWEDAVGPNGLFERTIKQLSPTEMPVGGGKPPIAIPSLREYQDLIKVPEAARTDEQKDKIKAYAYRENIRNAYLDRVYRLLRTVQMRQADLTSDDRKNFGQMLHLASNDYGWVQSWAFSLIRDELPLDHPRSEHLVEMLTNPTLFAQESGDDKGLMDRYFEMLGIVSDKVYEKYEAKNLRELLSVLSTRQDVESRRLWIEIWGKLIVIEKDVFENPSIVSNIADLETDLAYRLETAGIMQKIHAELVRQGKIPANVNFVQWATTLQDDPDPAHGVSNYAVQLQKYLATKRAEYVAQGGTFDSPEVERLFVADRTREFPYVYFEGMMAAFSADCRGIMYTDPTERTRNSVPFLMLETHFVRLIRNLELQNRQIIQTADKGFVFKKNSAEDTSKFVLEWLRSLHQIKATLPENEILERVINYRAFVMIRSRMDAGGAAQHRTEAELTTAFSPATLAAERMALVQKRNAADATIQIKAQIDEEIRQIDQLIGLSDADLKQMNEIYEGIHVLKYGVLDPETARSVIANYSDDKHFGRRFAFVEAGSMAKSIWGSILLHLLMTEYYGEDGGQQLMVNLDAMRAGREDVPELTGTIEDALNPWGDIDYAVVREYQELLARKDRVPTNDVERARQIADQARFKALTDPFDQAAYDRLKPLVEQHKGEWKVLSGMVERNEPLNDTQKARYAELKKELDDFTLQSERLNLTKYFKVVEALRKKPAERTEDDTKMIAITQVAMLQRLSDIVLIMERMNARNGNFWFRPFSLEENSSRALEMIRNRWWLKDPTQLFDTRSEMRYGLETFLMTALSDPALVKNELIYKYVTDGDVPYFVHVYRTVGEVLYDLERAIDFSRQEDPRARLDAFWTGDTDLESMLPQSILDVLEATDEGLGESHWMNRVQSFNGWQNMRPVMNDTQRAQVALLNQSVAFNGSFERFLFWSQDLLQMIGKEMDGDKAANQILLFDVLGLSPEIDETIHPNSIRRELEDKKRQVRHYLGEIQIPRAEGFVTVPPQALTLDDLRAVIEHQKRLIKLGEIIAKPADKRSETERQNIDAELMRSPVIDPQLVELRRILLRPANARNPDEVSKVQAAINGWTIPESLFAKRINERMLPPNLELARLIEALRVEPAKRSTEESTRVSRALRAGQKEADLLKETEDKIKKSVDADMIRLRWILMKKADARSDEDKRFLTSRLALEAKTEDDYRAYVFDKLKSAEQVFLIYHDVKNKDMINMELIFLQKVLDLVRLTSRQRMVDQNRELQGVSVILNYLHARLNPVLDYRYASERALGRVALYENNEELRMKEIEPYRRLILLVEAKIAGVQPDLKDLSEEGFAKELKRLADLSDKKGSVARLRRTLSDDQYKKLLEASNNVQKFVELENERRKNHEEEATYLAGAAIRPLKDGKFEVWYAEMKTDTFDNPEQFIRWLQTRFHTYRSSQVDFTISPTIYGTEGAKNRLGAGEVGNLLSLLNDVHLRVQARQRFENSMLVLKGDEGVKNPDEAKRDLSSYRHYSQTIDIRRIFVLNSLVLGDLRHWQIPVPNNDGQMDMTDLASEFSQSFRDSHTEGLKTYLEKLFEEAGVKALQSDMGDLGFYRYYAIYTAAYLAGEIEARSHEAEYKRDEEAAIRSVDQRIKAGEIPEIDRVKRTEEAVKLVREKYEALKRSEVRRAAVEELKQLRGASEDLFIHLIIRTEITESLRVRAYGLLLQDQMVESIVNRSQSIIQINRERAKKGLVPLDQLDEEERKDVLREYKVRIPRLTEAQISGMVASWREEGESFANIEKKLEEWFAIAGFINVAGFYGNGRFLNYHMINYLFLFQRDKDFGPVLSRIWLRFTGEIPLGKNLIYETTGRPAIDVIESILAAPAVKATDNPIYNEDAIMQNHGADAQKHLDIILALNTAFGAVTEKYIDIVDRGIREAAPFYRQHVQQEIQEREALLKAKNMKPEDIARDPDILTLRMDLKLDYRYSDLVESVEALYGLLDEMRSRELVELARRAKENNWDAQKIQQEQQKIEEVLVKTAEIYYPEILKAKLLRLREKDRAMAYENQTEMDKWRATAEALKSEATNRNNKYVAMRERYESFVFNLGQLEQRLATEGISMESLQTDPRHDALRRRYAELQDLKQQAEEEIRVELVGLENEVTAWFDDTSDAGGHKGLRILYPGMYPEGSAQFLQVQERRERFAKYFARLAFEYGMLPSQMIRHSHDLPILAARERDQAEIDLEAASVTAELTAIRDRPMDPAIARKRVAELLAKTGIPQQDDATLDKIMAFVSKKVPDLDAAWLKGMLKYEMVQYRNTKVQVIQEFEVYRFYDRLYEVFALSQSADYELPPDVVDIVVALRARLGRVQEFMPQILANIRGLRPFSAEFQKSYQDPDFVAILSDKLFEGVPPLTDLEKQNVMDIVQDLIKKNRVPKEEGPAQDDQVDQVVDAEFHDWLTKLRRFKADDVAREAIFKVKAVGLIPSDRSEIEAYIDRVRLDGWKFEFVRTMLMYRRYAKDIIRESHTYRRLSDMPIDRQAEAIALQLVRSGDYPVLIKLIPGVVPENEPVSEYLSLLELEKSFDSMRGLSFLRQVGTINEIRELMNLRLYQPEIVETYRGGLKAALAKQEKGEQLLPAEKLLLDRAPDEIKQAVAGDREFSLDQLLLLIRNGLIASDPTQKTYGFRPSKPIRELGRQIFIPAIPQQRIQESYFNETMLFFFMSKVELGFVRTYDDRVFGPDEVFYPFLKSVEQEGVKKSPIDFDGFREYFEAAYGKDFNVFVEAQKAAGRQEFLEIFGTLKATFSASFQEDMARGLMRGTKNETTGLYEMDDVDLLELLFIIRENKIHPSMLLDHLRVTNDWYDYDIEAAAVKCRAEIRAALEAKYPAIREVDAATTNALNAILDQLYGIVSRDGFVTARTPQIAQAAEFLENAGVADVQAIDLAKIINDGFPIEVMHHVQMRRMMIEQYKLARCHVFAFFGLNAQLRSYRLELNEKVGVLDILTPEAYTRLGQNQQGLRGWIKKTEIKDRKDAADQWVTSG
ncbi:MAG: hypothetical protein PHN49_06900, partial [Candidatus Omnitrophica bacterium]|nr:hypothetical protein [Candidatus Omnitrophota bacterium]